MKHPGKLRLYSFRGRSPPGKARNPRRGPR